MKELEMGWTDAEALTVAHSVRGGSQAHVMHCSDGFDYVVKARNNPQGVAVLACEYIGSRIMREMGLSCPPVARISVPESVAERTCLRVPHETRYAPGLCCGSRYPVEAEAIYDYLPQAALDTVSNRREFLGAAVADKWLCNHDGRQVIFLRARPGTRLRAHFIDQGFAFGVLNGMHDSPYRGIYPYTNVYGKVTGWDDFEPWLSKAENFPARKLQRIIADCPDDWVAATPEQAQAMKRDLMAQLVSRQPRIRELLAQAQATPRVPFGLAWQPDLSAARKAPAAPAAYQEALWI